MTYALINNFNQLVGFFRRIKSAKRAGEKTKDYYQVIFVKDRDKTLKLFTMKR